jgi:hypothetical protein
MLPDVAVWIVAILRVTPMQRLAWNSLLAAFLVVAGNGAVRADSDADTLQKQKESAAANWKKVFGEEQPVQEETDHLLIFGPQGMTGNQLKNVGKNIEKECELARKALNVESPDDAWTGKLAVYLIEDRRHFNSFLRSVVKRRPTEDDLGAYFQRGYQSFVVAGPPRGKLDPSMESQAGEQVAALMLAKVGGNSVPEWVILGFGRATAWEANPTAHAKEKSLAKALVYRLGKNAKDVWDSKLNAEQAPLLRASLVSYLAYGPGAKNFTKFLEGYAPDEKNMRKTTMDALKAINAKPEELDRSWKAWVATAR